MNVAWKLQKVEVFMHLIFSMNYFPVEGGLNMQNILLIILCYS